MHRNHFCLLLSALFAVFFSSDLKNDRDWQLRATEEAATIESNAAQPVLNPVSGRVVCRRLNRVEYENSVRDLLGIDVDLQQLLSPDQASNGFDNVGEALHVSSFLMDRYLEAADRAINLAVATRPQPPLVKKRSSLKETHHLKTAEEKVYRQADDGRVTLFSSSPWNAVVLTPLYPPDRGRYRFRMAVTGVQSKEKPVTVRIDAGPMLMATKNHLVGYFDASPDRETIIEFEDHFEARSTIRLHPYGLANAQTVNKVGADAYDGPGLAVDWVEVEGPLNESWPPECHRQIFGDLEFVAASPDRFGPRMQVNPRDPKVDASEIVRRFARRAYRRAVTEDDVEPIVALIMARLAVNYSFEQAVRVGLTAVLVSSDFLFLKEAPGKLNDFALASRLSYFFWSSIPDEELLKLAEAGNALSRKTGVESIEGTLADPKVLHAQVERMLQSPKARAFRENFVGQWLGLRDIDFTEPSSLLYPEFDEMLKLSMVREAELFFGELLEHDLSLHNFVSSDFAMLNGRLARHYGISGIDGWEFRKTSLPPGSHRGGVMTMAGVLKVTANGTNTSPVTRGAWVLDRILGSPPSPPPQNVAAIEPDIRGAATIREQLAKHRATPACAACHESFDPIGFALESFDVIGGWRENYRVTNWYRGVEEVFLDGKRMPYLKGLKIDPADELADGRKFSNIDDLKQLLLADPDQIAQSLATKLVIYATGGVVGEREKPEIDRLVKQCREQDYRFRSLIHSIVQSELFLKN